MKMITGKQLQINKNYVVAFCHSLNDATSELDAIVLITRMNDQRNILIDYIMLLEQYIGEHEGTWKEAKK